MSSNVPIKVGYRFPMQLQQSQVTGHGAGCGQQGRSSGEPKLAMHTYNQATHFHDATHNMSDRWQCDATPHAVPSKCGGHCAEHWHGAGREVRNLRPYRCCSNTATNKHSAWAPRSRVEQGALCVSDPSRVREYAAVTNTPSGRGEPTRGRHRMPSERWHVR